MGIRSVSSNDCRFQNTHHTDMPRLRRQTAGSRTSRWYKRKYSWYWFGYPSRTRDFLGQRFDEQRNCLKDWMMALCWCSFSVWCRPVFFNCGTCSAMAIGMPKAWNSQIPDFFPSSTTSEYRATWSSFSSELFHSLWGAGRSGEATLELLQTST